MNSYPSDMEAAAVLREAGLLVDSISWNAGLQRCPTHDKPKSRNGAYIAHSDAPTSVWWQNWASGESGTWTAMRQGTLSAAERDALARRTIEGKAANEAARLKIQVETAKKAQGMYARAMDCRNHAYLERKGVQPVAGLKMYDGALVIPLHSGTEIVSLQFIQSDGTKRFLSGGRKKGCFFRIGDMNAEKPLLICEGLATGLSLYECTDYPVLIAFDAGNLLPVAEMARQRAPERKIIVCADNDTDTPGNPGLSKATAAARAIGALLAVPSLQSGSQCDWNTLHLAEGRDAVWQQFSRAKRPEPVKDVLPNGFSLRLSGAMPGLYHIEVRENGEPIETWLCGPIDVLGLTRDRESKAWGILLHWKDADGVDHQWAMPLSLLAGRDASAWLCILADGGLSIGWGTRVRGLLNAFLMSYRTERRALCVNRCGWHGGNYVFPDATLQTGQTGRTGQGSEDADFAPSSSGDSVLDGLDEKIVLQLSVPHNPFACGGTLKGWQSTIGTWAVGNSRLCFAVCAALAGALLEPFGMESGGFNFVGGSSIGKTTALLIASSVWGNGSASGGYSQSWRATANGLEGLAALHSDALLALDEIGQASSRGIAEMSYMVANGMGKTRAAQDGNAKLARNWRCMVLSTGEVGLAEKIREEGGNVKAGQLVRLVDIPADAGAGMGLFENTHDHAGAQSFADAIKQAAKTEYGHLARMFIAGFIQQRDRLEADTRQSIDSFLPRFCPDDADGQVKRVARRFLLCAAAGEMAVKLGLLPWEHGTSLAATEICFNAWLAQRGGFGAAEDTDILAQTMLFLEQHGASRFQDIAQPDAVCRDRVGFRATENGKTTYYILPESFKAEVCKGALPARAAALLRKEGLLLPGDSGSFTRRPAFALPGLGRKRCYTVIIAE